MRNLQELEVTKQLKSRRALKTVLQEHGWHLLGEGKDATVAEHPKRSYVLKIWARGSLYEKFVPFVEKHQHNPHLPKFSRYIKKVPGTKYLYVRMEKLHPVTNTELLSKYLPEITYLYLAGLKLNLKSNLEWMLEYKIEEYLLSLNITRNVEDFKDPNLETQLWNRIGAPPQSWTTVCDQFIAHTVNLGIQRLDIHDDNVMHRNNTLVITDPYYR